VPLHGPITGVVTNKFAGSWFKLKIYNGNPPLRVGDETDLFLLLFLQITPAKRTTPLIGVYCDARSKETENLSCNTGSKEVLLYRVFSLWWTRRAGKRVPTWASEIALAAASRKSYN